MLQVERVKEINLREWNIDIYNETQIIIFNKKNSFMWLNTFRKYDFKLRF